MSMKVICDFLFVCSYTKCDVRVKTKTQKKGNEGTSIPLPYKLVPLCINTNERQLL